MKNTARFYDFYLVTTFGAIYSFLTKQNVPMHLNNGYYEVYLRHPEKATLRIKLHRVVALCFLPPIAGKEHINHKNGIKTDNRSENLEWCTAAENNKHARDTGLNDISSANRARWSIEANREKMSKLLQEYRKSHPLGGRDNPNYRYNYRWNGNTYLIRELRDLFGCTDGQAFRYARAIRENRPNPWSDAGVELLIEKGQSTIERGNDAIE